MAFRTLYERHWQRLYDLARYRLGEVGEAEEVVQDIFCKLWQRRATIVVDKSFEQYFSGAVKFEVINRLAKRARSRNTEKEWAAKPTAGGTVLHQQLDYNNLQQQLRKTVNSLPQQSRQVYQLRHEGGYTLQQIAHHLGISIKTVEAHLTRARKVIRLMIGSFLS